MEALQNLGFWGTLLVTVVLSALPLVFVLLYAYGTLYLEMKVAAHVQDRLAYMRTGWHGVLQPLADFIKLFQKEDIVSVAADKKLFLMAPYIVFMGTYAAYAAIPFSSIFIGANIDLGAFFIIGISSLVVVGILMAGWSSNNKWSIFGAVRSAAQLISYEIPTALAVLIAVMITGSLNLQEVTQFQAGGIQNWIIFGGPLPLLQKILITPFTIITFLVLFVASLAECNRTPFDLPEAESELVQGFFTEYSGMRWAMFYVAEYANMFLVSCVATTLFLGGWHVPYIEHLGLSPTVLALVQVAGFFVKVVALLVFYIVIRWTIPRFRYDQLMNLGWKVMLPLTIANTVVTGLVLLLLA